MHDIAGLIKNILIWGMMTVVFACIGFFTENPAVMVPLYGVIFLCFIGIVFYSVSRKRVKTLEDKETHQYVFIGIAVVGLLLSILSPAFLLSIFRPDLFNNGTVIAFTIVLLVLGFIGVYLINVLGLKNFIFSIAGFVLLIVTSLLPAIMVTGIDPSFGTMGVLYFVTLLDAVIAWETFEVYKKINLFKRTSNS